VVITLLVAAAVAQVAAIALVAAARQWAHRQQVLDAPSDRGLHVRPTPRAGGIGIVVPACVGLVAVGLTVPAAATPALSLAALGLLIALVGLVDDVRHLPAGLRLVVHFGAAGLAVWALGGWPAIVWPGLFDLRLAWASVPLTILLIAYLTNAYNFMDGSDGIAGTQAFVAGLGWAAAGALLEDPLIAVTGAVVAASSLGFLLFNWEPASVFMGDVGSGFIGFLLASLAVAAEARSPGAGTAGLLFVWPFLFDSAFTLVWRARQRENLMVAHRAHLYQRLILTGVSHGVTAAVYGALALVGVGVGYAVMRGDRTLSVAGAVAIVALATGLWWAVVRRERALGIPGV
jgi:UDP-N-acetylmuramyl pentapeptide phosphotransferase/UDP-N-acetylglucosamine-1-phosphate transferase